MNCDCDCARLYCIDSDLDVFLPLMKLKTPYYRYLVLKYSPGVEPFPDHDHVIAGAGLTVY